MRKINSILATLAILSTSPSLFAQEDNPARPNRALKLASQYTDGNFDVSGDILDFDLPAWLNFQFGGGYGISSSKDKKYFSRIDRTQHEPGFDIPLPIYTRLRKERNVVFVRQYTDENEALAAKRLSFKDVPYSSDKLAKLPSNTMVSLPLRLDIVPIGIRRGSPGPLSLSAGYLRYRRGDYLVQIFKRSETLVDVRLIEVKRKGTASSLRISFVPEIAGENTVNNAVARWTNFNRLLDYREVSEDGSTFATHYTLNLKSSEALKAYDALMQTTLHRTETEIFSDDGMRDLFRNKEELQVADISLLEKLSLEDQALALNQARVKRDFKIESQFTRDKSRLRGGVNYFAKYRVDTQTTINLVVSYDQNDQPVYFVNADRYQRKKKKFNLGFFKDNEKTTSDAFFLYRSNAQGEVSPELFSDFGVTFQMEDKDFSDKEQKAFKESLALSLPDSALRKIDWNLLENKGKEKVTIGYEVVLKKNVLEKILASNIDDIERKLDKATESYIDVKGNSWLRKRKEELMVEFGTILYDGENTPELKTFEVTHKAPCSRVDNEYDGIISRPGRTADCTVTYERSGKLSYSEKLEKLLNIHNDSLFSRVYLNFYMQFFSTQELADNLSFSLAWKSNKRNTPYTVEFNSGLNMSSLDQFRSTQGQYSNNDYDLTVIDADRMKK